MAKKASKSSNPNFDPNFKRLTDDVTAKIEFNRSDLSQQEQIDELTKAEQDFKKIILEYKQIDKIYRKFIKHVVTVNRNIASAKPFFRERDKIFTARIGKAIREEDVKSLKQNAINFQLINFIRENWRGPFPKEAEAAFQRTKKARDVLVENNIPLAINRAKIFFKATPKTHITMTDMVGIASIGLLIAIDKAVATEKNNAKNWRGVIVGRAVGFLIQYYSATQVHFYPNEKKILYRANSIKGRKKIDDYEVLCKMIIESYHEDVKKGIAIPKGGFELTPRELRNLMMATKTVSADNSKDDDGYNLYSKMESGLAGPEEKTESREIATLMLTLAKNLSIMQKKVLRLKGVKI